MSFYNEFGDAVAFDILFNGVVVTTSPQSIDFTGAGVTVTDDGLGNVTVNIPGGGSGGGTVTSISGIDPIVVTPDPLTGAGTIGLAFDTTLHLNPLGELSVVGGNAEAITAVVATTTFLPGSPVYNNGVAGVGATLTRGSNGAITAIDGVVPIVGQDVLIKDEVDLKNNGVYTLTDAGSASTPYVFTRSTNADEISELEGEVVIVTMGATQNGQTWEQLTDPIVAIGTSNIIYGLLPTGGKFVKQQTSGTQVAGQIPWWISAARTLSKGTPNFVWDFTNNRLGIGTSAPAEQLHITKNFRFPTTTGSTVGVFMKDTARFLHTYKPAGTNDNLFFGKNSGNFTLAATSNFNANVGIGENTLAALTTGFFNNAFGTNAGQFLTTGSYNNFFGLQAGRDITTGSHNTAFGESAMYGNSGVGTATGSFNVAIGEITLFEITSGSNNVAIGYSAGQNMASGSGNVFIGNAAGQNETGSNTLYIANTGTTTPLIKGDFSAATLNFTATSVSLSPFAAGAGNTTELRFFELAASGTNYTAFKAADTLAQTTTYIWPSVDPGAGEVLSASAPVVGVVTLSWASAGGGGTVTGTGAANQVAYWTGASAISGENDFTWNPTTNTFTISNGGNKQFLVDPANGLYELGDIDNAVNGTILAIDDTNQAITLQAGGFGFYTDFSIFTTILGGGATFDSTVGDGILVNASAHTTGISFQGSQKVLFANSNVSLKPYGGSAGNTYEIRYLELAASGTNYTAFKAADALAQTTTYIWPSVDPTIGQVLSATAPSSGIVTLSWVSTGAGSGTVTSVSVVSANGFAGTVATATTTPAITLTTTITGVLKGNGTAISAAVAGTDYVAPGAITTDGITMSTARLLGRTTAGTGAVEEITVGAGLTLSAGTLVATGSGACLLTTSLSAGITATASSTSFNAIGSTTLNGTEANREFVVPFAGTIKNLYLVTTSTQSGTGTMVVTVRKNGADTALTLTVGAGATAATFSDTTHSFSVAAGDLLSFKYVNNASATSAAMQTIGVVFI